jgi:hypothetical protein
MIQHMIEKMVAHPWVVAMLTMAFLASMAGFWLRIRLDERIRKEKQQTRSEQ